MLVSDLYGTLRGLDVFIVGTGPSMSVFPLGFLKDRYCILLNDAWKYLNLGPMAFSNSKQFLKGEQLPPKIMVVKARLKSDPSPERDDNHVRWGHTRKHCFSYREPPWDDVSHHDKSILWKESCHYWNIPGGSVAIFAVQFAVLAGARSVTVVGCDCCELNGRQYLNKEAFRDRMVRTKRIDKRLRHNYRAYACGLRYVADRALKDYGVPVVSSSPFFGFGWEELQLGMLEKK